MVETKYDDGVVVVLWLYQSREFSILFWKVFDEAVPDFEASSLVNAPLALLSLFHPCACPFCQLCVFSFVVDGLAGNETLWECSSRLFGRSDAPSADRRSCLHCYRSSTPIQSMERLQSWNLSPGSAFAESWPHVQRFAVLYQYRACHSFSIRSLCSRTRQCSFFYRASGR